MRVLLFAYYFPPLGGIGSLRALGLARHLPAAGVEVTVVAPRTGTYGRDPSLATPVSARVVRTGSLEPSVLFGRADRTPPVPTGGAAPARPRGRSLCRLLQIPDGNAGWIPAAIAAGIAEGRRRRPDVVLSSSPPLSAHLAASFVARRLRVPFVADFRDFFDTQRMAPGLRERLDARIEDGLLKRLAGVVAATEGVLADLRPRTEAPALVLRNGYDEEDFEDPAPPVDPARPFVLTHVGSSYAANRDPGTFLAAVRDLREDGLDLRLRFQGAPDAALLAAAEREGVPEAIELAGFATHAEAVEAMRRARALLLFVWGKPGKIDRGILAGKTYEYLRAGRPILVVGPADGETARAVREAGGGVQREIEDRDGIRGAIADLAAGRAPAVADPALLAPFRRRTQAGRLSAWLSDLVGSLR